MPELAITSTLAAVSRSAALIFLAQSFVSLFVVIDPIGNVPIFLSLLREFNEDEQRAIVRRAVLVGCSALLFVTLTGHGFFALLGISLYSFKIAGGVLLAFVSVEMLYGRKSGTETLGEEEGPYTHREDISILPLAIPLLTGPGAFSTGVVLFDAAGSLFNRMTLLLIIMAVYLISYLILSRSQAVFRRLGRTGTSVARRIMGLMLLSIAVQLVVGGIGDAFPGLK